MDSKFHALTDALTGLVKEATCYLRKMENGDELNKGLLAIKEKLAQMETRIMSAISDFAAKQNAFNDRIDAAVAGVTADVQVLNDKIAELQNSSGQISPEDQASLDAIEARGQALTDKLEALDALTPPKPPTA